MPVEVIYEQDTPVRETVTPVLALDVDSSSELKNLSYSINSPLLKQAAGADDSAAGTKVPSEVLTDGYVFQFTSQGLMLAKESFSLVPGEMLRPRLTTGLCQTIYVITNCGSLDLSSVVDLASFESLTYDAEKILEEDDIPYVGSAKGVDIEAGSSTPLGISLKRIVSRIEVNYTFNVSGVILESVSLMDAPSSVTFASPSADGISTFYPEAILESNFKNIDVPVDEQHRTSGSLSWYVSDNIRGAIPEYTLEQQKNAANAPSKSTYVLFTGTEPATGNTYRYSLYPGGDVCGDYNLRRGNTYKMNVAISDKGAEVDSRVEVDVPPVIIVHEYSDPANCYVVKPGGEVVIGYREGADGKKNSYTSGADVADACIVWQTKENGALALGKQSEVLSFSRDESLGDDLLTVKTAAEGNALVAVRDASGNILWSWHIWVTDYDPEETYLDYNNTIWMDRSLGALNSARDKSRTEGWLYQWGRKDPFPPIDWFEPLEESGSIQHAIALYDGDGNLLPDVDLSDFGVGDKQVAKMPVGSAQSNLEYSIAHPLTFIYNDDASESNTATHCIHWISSVQESDAMAMTLWSAVSKTAWDPCPAGWTVASTNFYSNDPPKHNSLTYTTNAISSFSSDNPQERGAYINVLDNKTVWVPFQGYRRCTKGGITTNCGDVGVFWTSNNQDACRTWAMKFRAADLRTMVTYPRSNGLCIRCVKIAEQ
ncbi:MAG: DUF4906 domain-containing protein [Bacteroidales bacterium]|nr:DUF4906 domain-containing protein [Bacteroidales bacterium]